MITSENDNNSYYIKIYLYTCITNNFSFSSLSTRRHMQALPAMRKNPDDCKKRAGEITQPTECQCCVGPIQGMKQTQVRMSKHSRHAPAMKNAVKFIGRRQYQLQILARSVRSSPAGTTA
jgi:hypothetical protein